VEALLTTQANGSGSDMQLQTVPLEPGVWFAIYSTRPAFDIHE